MNDAPRRTIDAADGMTHTPRITVIVPVWNGAGEIHLLLDALAAQTADPDAYEVIVVDNGSTDATRDVVSRYDVRLLEEPRPGSYAARNLAVTQARAPVLLFTDADCVPAPDWVDTALALMDEHGDDCLIGGRVELFSVGRTGPHSVRYEELTAFQQEWNVPLGKCVTANWLCSRRVLEEAGGFDDRLLSGGDVDCSKRIAARGHRLVYAPELVVRHPTRATLAQLARKRRRVIGGRWNKTGNAPTLLGLSRLILGEHVGQARWMKNAVAGARPKIGLLLVIGSLWAVSQAELVRLKAGGKPFRA